MILRSVDVDRALDAWRERGRLVDRDTAQTVASWWYSPAAPVMTGFATRDRIVDRGALAREVRHELRAVRRLMARHDPDREALVALLAWARASGGRGRAR